MDNEFFLKFKKVLAQSLMLDHAELDFGIYRIMNQKQEQISCFVDNGLHQLVEKTLNEFVGTDIADLKKQLAEKETAVRQLGIDPSEAKPVRELRERLAQATDTKELEGHVYDHLARFLARYYDNGDFMPIRRYRSGDTYAIPYDGEEVKLYWANADQYYIKTAEYFRHYAFNTPDGKRVEFTLREATTEQNNNKEEKGKERRFRLAEENPVEMQGDTLHIYFTYEPMPKATKQRNLVTEALRNLTSILPNDYKCLLAPCKDGDARSLLEKHLTDYVTKNSFDYFIHKDLRDFLSRELDFFVKNEMLVIDDIDTKDSRQFLGVLAEVKAVKVIGGRIIDFLAQIENFQKRLWLKRKFVTQADYCITLDRIPRELYAEICANDRQREEWVRLFAINEIRGDLLSAGYSEPLSEAFLQANPYLVLDTALFSADFKHRLLASISNIDEQCNGLLINSENFQALRLMGEKYREKVKCIYIDPPYNTGNDGFIYKDGYPHSTWLSFMKNRLEEARTSLSDDGVIFISIDDHEVDNLKKVCNEVFGEGNFVAKFDWRKKTGANDAKDIAVITETVLLYAKEKEKGIQNKIWNRDADSIDPTRYRLRDQYYEERGPYYYDTLDRGGLRYSDSLNFGILAPDGKEIYPNGRTCFVNDGWTWKWSKQKVEWGIQNGFLEFCEQRQHREQGSMYTIKYKVYQNVNNEGMAREQRGRAFSNLILSPINQQGNEEVANMFGESNTFSNPKPIGLIQYLLKTLIAKELCVLDFFAGSGTTAHAAINLNREDGGQRKYILVEMGSYFDTVTKPRVMKAVYSKDWNDGKPVSRGGISHCFKYLRLEQYEDTLNNLELPKKTDDKGLFEGQFRTDYTLGYMLDTETKDSLLNMQWFDHPFDVKMKITQGTETTEQTVDLVETFNYLIGLEVDTMEWPQEGLCIVQGSMRQGGRTAVVWRDKEKVTDDSLRALLTGRMWDAKRIFLNGDTAMAAALSTSLAERVMNTEEEFNRRMFNEKD